MSATNPAGDTILKNLYAAVDQLKQDVSRVEIWAHALETFTRPVPDYDHGQNRFALPRSSGARIGAAGVHDASRD